MDLSLSSRFKNAWNAFRNRAPTMMSQNIGSGYSYRPDRFRLTRGNERSIVTSVYNRIALDVAAINIQHVQLDDEGRFLNVIKSGLNECLSLEANLDQTGRAFIQDVVMSMMDEGCVAIVPVDTDDDPDDTKGYQILSMRVGRIRDWYPRHVRVEVYNENTGRKQEIVVPKDTVAIVENPLYAVINEPNSTMQRLIRKLNLLDAVDEQSSSGKLDLIIQLPYVIKSEARRHQAEQRRKDIEQQLSGSKYGIAYTDGTERITQLNRSLENNLMKQIEYLTSMLYSQLGITQSILDGTADEKTNAQKGNLTSTFTTMMQAVLTTLTNYQTQFNTAGSTLMTKFISGIKSQDGNTKTAITNIISGCITSINNKQTQFNTAGANLMIKLIAGVKSKDYETRNAFVNILSSCLTAIANKYPEFQNAGMQCMIKFIAGVKEKAEEVKTAFTGNLNASVTAIRDYHDQFKQAGAYLVEGFADGISENTYRAEAKARAMARAAAEAAEDELDEHSPSRVGYHIGDFFGLGFVNAIGTYAVKAYNASAEMADSAKTGLGNAIAKVKDMIDNGVDTQPTIRPILDLSDVEEKSHRLNTLFSRSQALTVSTGIAASRGQDLQNEDTNPNTGNSYNFTQNNYSPKALSRTEIYRQTKNQFSAMERMVET